MVGISVRCSPDGITLYSREWSIPVKDGEQCAEIKLDAWEAVQLQNTIRNAREKYWKEKLDLRRSTLN